MSWESVKIPDVLFFQEGPGVRNTQFTNSGVKLLNVGNINFGNLNLDATKIYISEKEANGRYKHFLVEEGDLLIASSGITVDNFHNKITWAKKEHLPLCLNTSTIRFRTLDQDILDIRYFCYFLKTRLFADQLSKLITGSAQLNFGPSHLKQINIPLPPLSTQKRIADILVAADALRKKDQELLKKYDELVQSIFIDMFGDPVKNEKGWEKCSIGSIIKVGSGGTPSRERPEYFSGKIPWVKTTEVNGNIIYFTEENITEEALNNSSCKIYPPNSIIVAMYGQGKTRGQVGILAIPSATNQACGVISPTPKLVPEFIFQYLKMSYNELRSLGRGGNQENLNKGMIESFLIIIPPISLQEKFKDLVENILHQVNMLKKKESSLLFDSLVQKAFNEELV